MLPFVLTYNVYVSLSFSASVAFAVNVSEFVVLLENAAVCITGTVLATTVVAVLVALVPVLPALSVVTTLKSYFVPSFSPVYVWLVVVFGVPFVQFVDVFSL